MATSVNYHCDHSECNHWIAADPLSAGWLVVRDGTATYHYCCWNCVMLDAAKVSAPIEV